MTTRPNPNLHRASGLFLFLMLLGSAFASDAPQIRPLKIFILAGQSNMQGHANISTMDAMATDRRTAQILKEMRSADGKPIVLNKVWISSVGCAGDGWSDVIEQTGKLTAGFGASPSEIGPEFTFGLYMERALKEPILIIKTSWGGRSLLTDFRPPSGGPRVINDYTLARWKERHQDPTQEAEKIRAQTGVFYHHMIDHIRKVLGNIKRVVPEYDPKQGFELAGFVWFQGFNDMIDDWSYRDRMQPGGYAEYSELLADLMRDVRKDLSAPKLPFVVGIMGVGGDKEGAKPPQLYFRQAQLAPTLLPEFKRNTVAVETTTYWDDELDELQQRMEQLNNWLDREAKNNPNWTDATKRAARQKAIAETFTPEELKRMKGISNGGYHYLGAAKILAPIGKAFAEALLGLMS